MRSVVVATLAALLLSCGGDDVTELLVVVDSDLAVPGDMDTIRVQVSGSVTMTATGELSGPRGLPLPRTVGVVHTGGPLGPVEIVVQGLSTGAVVVERRASTSFRDGKTLVLPMFLSRSCMHMTCGDGQTCVNALCVTSTVDPATLGEYNGTVPRIDGGTGGCEGVPERCNGLDDDCDRSVDEDFDLDADPINCGACGTACNRPNSTVACNAGSCEVTGCAPGFGDCNMDDADGCEVDFTDSGNCGGCGVTCDLPNATAGCDMGACGIESCDAGFDNCNGSPADGCEAALDTATDCGACGTTCTLANATAGCDAGACAIESCDAGYGDCNADSTDGCETPLDTPTDCGGCGMACDLANATESCATGRCEVTTCDAGFGDCNGMRADGCERALNTLSDCGMCGRSCNLSNATESCATGTCEIAMCAPGRGNCDGMAMNGCEINLSSDDNNCGMCGIVCVAPDNDCRSYVCR